MRIRILTLLVAFLLPLPLLADTTYTYTGNDFGAASAPFTTSDSVSGSFTISTLADNLSDVTITPTSFDFTDGVATITNTTSGLDIEAFSISTNASGEITAWEISFGDADADLDTIAVPGEVVDDGFDNSTATAGENFDDPGSWTETSVTPEPSTLALLGTGVFGLAGIVRRRFLHA